ncbi:MAG TPA: HNH endonuclease [Cytophagaceae bacterium]|jgi:hypothetical protein|nr:HNH endonuclease [Cytophagaceae bacterium]
MTCYKCSDPLIPKNQANPKQLKDKKYISEEHIIPNFCGGHIKSSNLLCEGCNNILGTELEGELSQQLIFARLIPFKLDRGKQQGLRLVGITKESRQEVLIDNKLQYTFAKPLIEFTDDGRLKKLRVKSEEEARHILTKLAKKDLSINVEEELKRIEFKDIYLEERVDFEDYIFGGKRAHRGIAKIALNFYLAKGGNRDLVKEIIKYICLPDVRNDFVAFYYPICKIHELAEMEISHVLYLKGDNKKKLLYCYIELFSTTNFIVILNNDYEGHNFIEQYCYSLIDNAEIIDKKIDLTLFTNPLEILDYQEEFDKYKIQTQQDLKPRISRAFRIVEKLNYEDYF